MGVICSSVVGAKRVARQDVDVLRVAFVVALCVNVKACSNNEIQYDVKYVQCDLSLFTVPS